MRIKRTSDYFKDGSSPGEFTQPPADNLSHIPDPAQENPLNNPPVTNEQFQAQQKKSDRGTKAGIIASLAVAVLIVPMFMTYQYWGGAGAHGIMQQPGAAQQKPSAPQDAEKTGAMRNGPYDKVDYATMLTDTSGKYFADLSLVVLNQEHIWHSSDLPKLVKVPFERAEAESQTAEAYRKINIATNKEFGTPIDLAAAYISADTKDGAKPENIDNTMGLALDFSAPGYKLEHFANSRKGKFITDNAALYGLILRYPEGKEDKTGIPYIPYKFRFVGYPHSLIMKTEGLCLDEYPEFLGENREYDYSGFVVSRQKGPEFMIPSTALEVHVSPDNTGYYIITARMPGAPEPPATVTWIAEHVKDSKQSITKKKPDSSESSSNSSNSGSSNNSEHNKKHKQDESDNNKKKSDSNKKSDENNKSHDKKKSESSKKSDTGKKSDSNKSESSKKKESN